MRPRALAWQAQSLLLGYPDEQLLEHVRIVRDVLPRLGADIAEPLQRFVHHVERTPLLDLAADYVATFDHKKRCSLFLTYYAYGDTRKRGMALLQLKQTYQRGGCTLVDDELPDHLAVVLEFAAGIDESQALTLLGDHRAGLEVLRLALLDERSPWADVLVSLSATLPALRGDERQAIAKLAAEGPPAEQVGLEPFAPPEYMPATTGSRS